MSYLSVLKLHSIALSTSWNEYCKRSSIDLRKRVVAFVSKGGSKAEASRRYEVSLWCVNDWCKRGDLTPKIVKRRKRKLDWEALERHTQEFPDALLRERAQHFGVRESAIRSCESPNEIDSKKKLLNTTNVNTNYGSSF